MRKPSLVLFDEKMRIICQSYLISNGMVKVAYNKGTNINNTTRMPIKSKTTDIRLAALNFVFATMEETIKTHVDSGPNITNSSILIKPYDIPVSWLSHSIIQIQILQRASQEFVTSIILPFYGF